MNFSSIKEYFYRLQSRCYAFVLLPVLLLIALYAMQRFTSLHFTTLNDDLIFSVQIALPAMALLELTSVHLAAFLKLKKIRKLKGMGERLDAYAILVTMKMIAGDVASVMMLAGLVLTGEELFIGFFMLCLAFILFQRPTPARLSRQLQLRGDEKELILKGELV